MRGVVLFAVLMVGASASTVAAPYRVAFVDHRQPPSWRALDTEARAQFELGHMLFNTPWVPAGTPRAARRDGLGPAFNAASCDACHPNGARMRGPLRDGPVPPGLVMQVQARDGGIPAQGHVLNTAVLPGHRIEAEVEVRYVPRAGRYPDGSAWRLHAPIYTVRLHEGAALPPNTVLKPRAAPALFGAGLLEAASLTDGRGRFGWQAGVRDLHEQTAQAFSREMGLTSAALAHDDCAATDAECRAAPAGGAPEVSAAFMQALLRFQHELAVPAPAPPQADDASGAALFATLGCADCHWPALPVQDAVLDAVAAYTDLRVHDLGPDLADRDAAGEPVSSAWRTAPLWGLAHALRDRGELALLHDGRARSIEEAVLWHAGAAQSSRRRFEHLPIAARQRLLDWLARR